MENEVLISNYFFDLFSLTFLTIPHFYAVLSLPFFQLINDKLISEIHLPNIFAY